MMISQDIHAGQAHALGSLSEIETPSGWTSTRKLLDFDLTLLSPFKEGHRALIGFLKLGQVNLQTLPSDNSYLMDFKKEKEDWIRAKGGRIIHVETKKNANRIASMVITTTYELVHLTFIEKQAYLFCDRATVLVKGLFSGATLDQATLFEDLLNKCRCGMNGS